jgi:iron(III) transport system substrate-binding protein
MEVPMKKLVVTIALLLIVVFGITAAGAKETAPAAPVQEKVMTHDELVAAAQAEGKVVVYSITSRIAGAAVEFEKKYGIKVEASNLKDGELIEKVTKEVGGGIQGADFVISQDSGRVYGQLIATGYLVNYVPESMKNVIPVEYQNPLVFQLINKVFIFNNEKTQTPVIKNVWELTEPQWKGLVQFKDPKSEGVNANFLTMVTSPEWSAKLDKAYQDLYGKKLVLTTKNAGYEWIKRFFQNGLVLGNSDTTISENIGIKGQPKTTLGLFVYSKTRFDAKKNLALQAMTDVAPFSGFLYPAFLSLTKNAKNPNAAKLFIEYLLTQECRLLFLQSDYPRERGRS